jgi:hypothetical protein
MKMFLLKRFLRLRRAYRVLLRDLVNYFEHEPPKSTMMAPVLVKSPAVFHKSNARLGRPRAPSQRDAWL